MKKILLLISAISLSLSGYAQKGITLDLWSNNAPNSNYITEKEAEIRPDRIVNVTNPTITVYPAQKPNGLAVVACPGGAYALLAIAHEGHDMAAWFNSLGITYCVLKYRMPNTHHDVPLSDAHQAIRLMRENSEKWHIDKVGIMGFSAGGHLASTAATHFDAETRPDFQILFYPVVNMNKAITHAGSRNNLLGKTPSKELLDLYSNELQVTKDTPPAFILHSSDDKVVPVENSINYYMALVRNKVPVSLHTYPSGGHGWGFNDSFIYKRQWSGELEKWLDRLQKESF